MIGSIDPCILNLGVSGCKWLASLPGRFTPVIIG